MGIGKSDGMIQSKIDELLYENTGNNVEAKAVRKYIEDLLDCDTDWTWDDIADALPPFMDGFRAAMEIKDVSAL